MPRSFVLNDKCFPMAAVVMISLVLVVLMALTFSTSKAGDTVTGPFTLPAETPLV